MSALYDRMNRAAKLRRERERELAEEGDRDRLLLAYRLACAGWVLAAERAGSGVPVDAISWAKRVWDDRMEGDRVASNLLFEAMRIEASLIYECFGPGPGRSH